MNHLLSRALLCAATLACAGALAAPDGEAAAALPTDAPAGTASAPGCRPLTEQARAADLKAASAKSQRLELEQVAALHEEAVGLWRQASERCEDRARERALRNLEDSRKAAAAISEVLGAGPQCGAAQKDAAALQELAKQASGERRWQDAAILYRKAESQWDEAAEHCSGAQQQLAQTRREQSEIDGHNAEFCAPTYERAREQTQRLKSSGAGMDEAQRRQLSQVAETLWRDAASRCRGNAQDLARSNAQAVARERGTPWVATADPGQARVPAPGPAAAASTLAAATGGGAAGAAAAASGAGKAGAAAAPAAAALPAAPSVAAVAAQPKAIDEVSGEARFTGQFVAEPGERAGHIVYSGQGKVAWNNGDVYEGLLVRGQRHGQGRFAWASGQQYEGEWVQDRAQGRGRIRFPNGNQYEGQVADGIPEGSGRMAFASGDVYSGQFERGIATGRGEYVWRNGQRYEGTWKAAQPHGTGTMRFANGNVYEGPLVEGQPQGEGRMRYASGDVYTGPFAAGLPDGKGRYAWKNGDVYVGAFKAGRKQGAGTLTWSSGDRWEGMFDNDEQYDAGTFTASAKP